MKDTIAESKLRAVAAQSGTPCFVYSRSLLQERAEELAKLKLPFGYVPRYAMKANNHPDIIRLFDKAGLHFDASSSYEAQELLDLGVAGDKISLSSQQPAHNLDDLLSVGVRFIATSMRQLELFLSAEGRPKTVGLRVNPGFGAGHNNRLMTGGANSSFGLWNSYVPQAIALADEHNVKIDCIHAHIGTGADPAVWKKAMEVTLDIVRDMPDVTSIDIGGGFKTHYFSDDHETDMAAIAKVFSELLEAFALETGRKLQLETETGRWLVVHAGVLVSKIVDIVDTGEDGHTFVRLNTGMNDFLRPAMYGSQHDIQVLNDSTELQEYIVVGHCCETSDVLTTAPSDPEGLEPRELRRAQIGDVLAVYDAGAYCRSMSARGYNSFPEATEVFVD